MVPIKSKQDIQKMREGGKILAATFEALFTHAKPGISAAQLDRIAYETIISFGAEPSFLGYQGFKHSTCISKNEEVVHGIPDENKILFDGDICSIDVGVFYKGFHVDAARIFIFGDIDKETQHLVDVTTDSFYHAIEHLKSGSRLGDMSHSMQTYIESHNLSVVRDLYSHGVGKQLHEDPLIPNYGKANTGIVLKEGMVFAIEPMANLGTHEVLTLDDKWTIITADYKWSAHYENTVYITDNGPEILTIY